MIKVVFKNLEKSELAREVVQERVDSIVEKFEKLKDGRIQVTLEMQNSPSQSGPDLFKVKLQVSGSRYHGLRVEKSATSLYVALADMVDHMLELLNRFSDKIRVKERNHARKLFSQTQSTQFADES